MRITVLILGIGLLTGCAKSAWPSDVKPGARIELLIQGSDTSGVGTVVKVDGDWLAVALDGRTSQSAPTQVPREKVTFIRVAGN